MTLATSDPFTGLTKTERQGGWVKVMKKSIKSNGPRFSSRRMVKEYIDKFYRSILITE